MTQTYVRNKLVELFETIEPVLEKNEDGEITNVNYEFEAFDREGHKTWLELFFIPSPPVQTELGTKGRNTWMGLFQINLCAVKNKLNQVASAADEDETEEKPDTSKMSVQEFFDYNYNAIAEVMKRGVIYKGVRVIKIYNSPARDFGDYFSMPVTVEWQAYLDN